MVEQWKGYNFICIWSLCANQCVHCLQTFAQSLCWFNLEDGQSWSREKFDYIRVKWLRVEYFEGIPFREMEMLQYDHLELSKTKFFWLRTETSLRASQCAKSFVCLGHFDISGILDLQIKWKIFIGLFVTCDDWRKLEEMHQNRSVSHPSFCFRYMLTLRVNIAC